MTIAEGMRPGVVDYMLSIGSNDLRRKLAQYSTPPRIAEFMACWAIRHTTDVILEPCIGKGAMITACRRKLLALGCTEEDARPNIFGIDIDKNAVKDAITNGSRGNYLTSDFLQVEPGDEFKDGRRIPLVDVVLCNPPYTRHHLLSKKYKSKVSNDARKSLMGVEIDQRSGLYIYFLIHALKFLKTGARLAFIIPSQFLETNYARPMRQVLAQKYRIVSIIRFDTKSHVFPGVSVTPCIILVENTKDRPEFTASIQIVKWPPTDTLLRCVNELSTSAIEPWGKGEAIRSTILSSDKWTHPGETVNGSSMIRLGSLIKVQRGIATGANKFFTLTDTDAKRMKIERRFLRPILVSPTNARGLSFRSTDFEDLRIKGKRVWLLDCGLRKKDLKRRKVLKYILSAERKGYNKRALTSNRKPWYRPEQRVPAPILFTYMTSGRPRFIHNVAQVLNLNNMHCLYFDDDISRSNREIAEFVRVLNSAKILMQLPEKGRMYGGGLLKVEPRELENVMLDSGSELIV